MYWEQHSYWEANSRYVSRENASFLWKPTDHHRVCHNLAADLAPNKVNIASFLTPNVLINFVSMAGFRD